MSLSTSTPNSSPAASTEAVGSEQDPLLKSLGMHLLPGVFIVVLFVAIAPGMLGAGLPPLVAVLISALLGLAFQAWHLLREGKKRNGKWSLAGIVTYRHPMPLWQYFVLVPIFVILAFIISGPAGAIGTALLKLMPWLPAWFEVRDPAILRQYPRGIIAFTYLALNFPINGLAAPIIEELYFRGYLMPRLSRFGNWTPLIATALFTVYHFWQPYYWPTLFLGILPVVYAVWWKRNVRLGILIHALLNIVGGLLTFALLIGQP